MSVRLRLGSRPRPHVSTAAPLLMLAFVTSCGGDSGTNNPEPGVTTAAPPVTPTQANPPVTPSVNPSSANPNPTPPTSLPPNPNPPPGTTTPGTTTPGTTTPGTPTNGTPPNPPVAPATTPPGTEPTAPPTSSTPETSTSEPGEDTTDDVGNTHAPSSVAELAELPCGAKYTAIGDGGWILCARLSDGGGACADKGAATFHRVTFEDGSAINNVAQISGFGDTSIGVVTTDGALYTGVGPTGIKKTPLIAEGVVNFSGGYHSRVALTKAGGQFGVVGWEDAGSPAPVALPADVSPVQVSGNYGLACALATTGDVYCWSAGGNHSIMSITATPSKVALDAPVRHVSVGQNTVCGVTFDDKLTCVAAWHDSPWLPSEGQSPNFTVRQSTFPVVREVHAGFGQGIIVDGDGVAHFLSGNGSPPADNPGSAFTGVTNVIAAGGDRGNACVQNAAGELYCWVGGATRATLDGQPIQVAAADCPQ